LVQFLFTNINFSKLFDYNWHLFKLLKILTREKKKKRFQFVIQQFKRFDKQEIHNMKHGLMFCWLLKRIFNMFHIHLIPYYLGQFDTNYIIFRIVEIFKNYFFQIKKYCEGYQWIFGNIPSVEMKISKLINYSMAMCWNGQGTTVSFENQRQAPLWVHLC
jgi:hypothetical protein